MTYSVRALKLALCGSLVAACSSSFALLYQGVEDPYWTLELDVLYVQRKGIDNVILVADSSQSGATLLNTTMVLNHFRWEPGVKGALTYTLSAERALECNFSWIHQWHSYIKVYGGGGGSTLSFPFSNSAYTTDYSAARSASATYTSRIWNGELNYWRYFTPAQVDYFSAAGVLGVRGMYIGEHFDLTFNTPPDASDYWTITRNRLCGIQAGGMLQCNPTSRWTWEITGKAGILANCAWGRYRLGDVNDAVVLRSWHGFDWKATYLLDGLFNLMYRFHTYASIHIGYQLIGFWGLALAPEQLSTGTMPTSGNQLNDRGNLYLHAAMLGFNFNF